MRLNLFRISLLLLASWQLLTASLRDPNNPPAARTGAPGETTCAASGCHSGGSYTGTVSISGIPDTIKPNTTYTITLTNASNATRAGFELTCLDNSGNAKCGILTNGTGTSIGNSGGRQYIRQSTPKNLSSGTTSWTFTWTSPATIPGNAATFYFVSLAANGNGKESGDNVLKASKVVALPPLVATHESPYASWVKLYPSITTDEVHIDLLRAASGHLALFNMQGQIVLQQAINATNTLEVGALSKGAYVAYIQFDGKTVVKKFAVQ